MTWTTPRALDGNPLGVGDRAVCCSCRWHNIKSPLASASDPRDACLIPGLGRYPGAGNGNPLQYSCLEHFRGQRSLANYSPWGHKESDTTERWEELGAERVSCWNFAADNLCSFWCLFFTLLLPHPPPPPPGTVF